MLDAGPMKQRLQKIDTINKQNFKDIKKLLNSYKLEQSNLVNKIKNIEKRINRDVKKIHEDILANSILLDKLKNKTIKRVGEGVKPFINYGVSDEINDNISILRDYINRSNMYFANTLTSLSESYRQIMNNVKETSFKAYGISRHLEKVKSKVDNIEKKLKISVK